MYSKREIMTIHVIKCPQFIQDFEGFTNSLLIVLLAGFSVQWTFMLFYFHIWMHIQTPYNVFTDTNTCRLSTWLERAFDWPSWMVKCV